MLDAPLASLERTFDAPPQTVSRSALDWRPRHVLVPVWRLDKTARSVKRATDLAFALVALIVLAPLMAGIAAAIRLDSGGPILFRQRRVGLHGAPFVLLKFRTMYCWAGDPGPLRQATRHDPRVTRVGGWLRRHSLDELPQLFNVLMGAMSLVGPRPHAPGTCAGGRLFEEISHLYPARHCVKPGITGLAQVRGWRGETDTEDKLLRRIECDLEYIADWSASLDLRIIWRTALTVFRMRNAY
jgi:lipopolysaccharide/colanic/teichoic acid biosynthesis glycosyltransferase